MKPVIALVLPLLFSAHSGQAEEKCQFNTNSVIKAASAAVGDKYVLANKADILSKQIAELADSAELEQYCNNTQIFSKKITDKLRELSGDKHFYLEHVGDQDESNNWIEQWRIEAPKNNYGVKKIEILSGNIAYISLSSFHTFENAKSTLGAAFTLIQHSDGLILDLRNNGGGDENTAGAILESLIDTTKPLPFVIESREKKIKPSRITTLPWPAYGTERPLVILINDRSFSAAESVAFSLQQLGRAKIIGTASAGGAHMMDTPQSLPFGFEIGIPSSRPVSTLTEGPVNWEGHGVNPDIETGDQDSLQVALKTIKEQN
ncbi:S41 family peptidase [Microbulbifer epialgicus]|uniref:S41 family peptidase n=1 Tax=Microbulbifer epialgicus TaxID=393907 RepID=A0ABV4NZR1_9GAMM